MAKTTSLAREGMLFWTDINLHNRKRLSGSPINHQSVDWWNSYLKTKIETLKETQKTKISILVFILGALLFFINLQYNFLDEFDILMFWLSILLLFGIILYQIFFLKNDTLVLFELFIVYLLLHLVYQVGYYGLRGSDSYIDYNFLKTILNDHNFGLGQGVEGWPMMHIFTSIIATITKINPLLIAKFLPSFIASIVVMPIYLLVYNIYKDRKVALFSCLLFGTIPQFINFEGLFVRETFAIFIMILFFYILYASKRRSEYHLGLLSILLIPVIVFAHHLTSFMLIILLGIYLVVSKFVPYFYRKNVNIKRILSGRINIKIIFLVVLVAVLTYWVYQAVIILEASSNIFYEALGYKAIVTYAETIKLGTPIVTLRGNIIFYGFFFFHILFSLIVLIKLITKKNNQKIEDASFTLFLFFCMFYACLALYILGSLPFPERFLPFGWMFGVIPLVGCMLVLKKNMYKKILIALLISFVMFNLYNIDLQYYTGNASVTGTVTTEKEYLIAERFDFPEEYYGYGGVVGAIYDKQGIEQRTGGKSLESITDFHNFSGMAIINDEVYLNNIKEKSREDYGKLIKLLSFKNDKDIGKIYDLGSIYVLQGGK